MSRILLKKVRPWSIFKFSMVLYLVIFTIIMLLIGVSFLGIGISTPEFLENVAEGNGQFAQIAGVLTGNLLIAYMIIFVAGFISLPICALFNAIGVAIFNFIVWLSGGIELNLEQKEEYEHPPGMY